MLTVIAVTIHLRLTEGSLFLFTTFLVNHIGNILAHTGWVAAAFAASADVLVIFLGLILQRLGLFDAFAAKASSSSAFFAATRGVANPQAPPSLAPLLYRFAGRLP